MSPELDQRLIQLRTLLEDSHQFLSADEFESFLAEARLKLADWEGLTWVIHALAPSPIIALWPHQVRQMREIRQQDIVTADEAREVREAVNRVTQKLFDENFPAPVEMVTIVAGGETFTIPASEAPEF